MKEISFSYEKNILPLLARSLSWLGTPHSSSLIKKDLEHLNSSIINEFAQQPFTIDQREITLPLAWGFAYVMEGSKLGGRVIYKHIKKTLSLNEDQLNYLIGNGTGTSIKWAEFLQQLSYYASAKNCDEEIINGAIFTFNSIYQYFEVNKLPHEV